MNTNKLIGMILLALGAVLLFMGYQSSQGLDDQISEAVTGNLTETTIWYLVLGAVSVAAGIALLAFKK